MAMGPEAKLWKALKPHLDALGCFSTRIENRHGGGLPDVDVSSPVGVFKIELKICQKISIRLSDMQIAYNTLLTHKNGLSFILAEVPCRSVGYSFTPLFEDQEPSSEVRGAGKLNRSVQLSADNVGSGRGSRTEDRGVGYLDTTDRVGSGRGQSGRGRGKSGLGPRSGSGRVGDRYWLWVGSEAVEVGRSGLRHEALVTSDSLAELARVMIAVCEAHHRLLLEKAPRL